MPETSVITARAAWVTPLLLSACCAEGRKAAPGTTAEEQYIIICEREWAASVASGDTAPIERCLADDFVGIDPQGRTYDKVSMVRETRSAPEYFASNQLNEVKVRFFGNTAVAQGHESWQRHSGEPLRGRFVWTDTWVKRKGRWQIVAAEDLIAPEPAQR